MFYKNPQVKHLLFILLSRLATPAAASVAARIPMHSAIYLGATEQILGGRQDPHLTTRQSVAVASLSNSSSSRTAQVAAYSPASSLSIAEMCRVCRQSRWPNTVRTSAPGKSSRFSTASRSTWEGVPMCISLSACAYSFVFVYLEMHNMGVGIFACV